MKRRTLLALGLGGLVAASGQHYLSSSIALKPDSVSSADLTQLVPNGDVLFRFVAIGDVGTGQLGQYAVAQAMNGYWSAAPFSTVLLAGDNIYPNGEITLIGQVFEQPYAELLQRQVKFYASLGNHDVRTHQGVDEIAYPGYNMSARYYTFTQQSIQFFALDTNLAYVRQRSGETPWADQLRWLRTELDRSTADWKVVFGHHPVYSSGTHGSDSELARDFAPLFADYGVQLFINGHDHHYERTQPINGTTFLTTGNGARLRSVGESNWTAYAISQLGFTVFEVYESVLVIKAVGTDGTVFDAARIDRLT